MAQSNQTRRGFLKRAALTGAGAYCLAGTSSAKAAESAIPHLATNQYPWLTFYRRDGRDLGAELDAAVGEMAAAGLDGLEPLATSPADVDWSRLLDSPSTDAELSINDIELDVS